MKPSNFEDVQAFHDKFGLADDRPGRPGPLPAELLRFRLGFLIEELAEYAEACGVTNVAIPLHQLAIEARSASVFITRELSVVKAFDSLIDLSVVTLGTADFHGFPWQEGWDIVHHANMSKERAASDGSNSKRKSGKDVIKPAGWVPTDGSLRQLLGELGYDHPTRW